ncbi:MAG: hypothetical protein H7X79_05630 [Sporomusaceae bacterium]|nr:hypothetical protein [Sporomusaceae bacterium]
MASKTDNKVPKHIVGSRQDQQKISADELYFRHVDHLERWRQEYEQYQTVENKLAEISNFTYEEIDYEPLLVRRIFKERMIPDFSHILNDARISAEGKFLIPIITRVIILVMLIILLIIGENTLLLWLSGAGVFTVLFLLLLTIQERQSVIHRTIVEKQQEIDNRVVLETCKIAEEKMKHEDQEKQRIEVAEGLLAGEISATFTKIENVLAQLKVPFNLNVEIEIYNNIPSVKIWLPPTSIIPDQICIKQSSGRLIFKEKEIRAINKQYLELCAAIVIKVMSSIYSHIPTLNISYVYGMSKQKKNIECLIASKLERQIVRTVCSSAVNGLEAVQAVKADFKCNTALELLPVEVKSPEEWENAEQKLVRRLLVNIFK